MNQSITENKSNQCNPAAIMQIGMGFWASKVLLTAVNFGLFTRLAEQGAMSAAEIKSALGLIARTEIFSTF